MADTRESQFRKLHFCHGLLGENIILLVNLAWSARLYARFLRGRGSFAALESWQMAYLPVYSVWAGLVIIFFPPLFGYV